MSETTALPPFTTPKGPASPVITIPTAELVGVLSDAIPFASKDEDFPALNAVRLHWDGDMLHAQATDRYVLGWSQWDPSDDPDRDEQEDLFTKWGGADDPWTILLPLADATDIVKVFKLGPKEGWTPLTIDLIDGRLKVMRHRDTGHSAITQVVEGLDAEFPKLDELLRAANMFDTTDGLSYDAKRMALFARVRPRGPMRLTFTAGPGGGPGLTHVQIGERFNGAIMPVREKDDEAAQPVEAEKVAA
jgi:hypothetical protein